MNGSIAIEIIIALAGFVLSMLGTVFVIGVAWGSTRKDITSIDRRLAKIEGMFVWSFNQGNPPGGSV